MKEKLRLDNVTLVYVACNKIGETVASIYKTLNKIIPARTILFTDTPPILSKDIEVIKIEKLDWKQYNHFIVKRLAPYIETEFILIAQWDSWVLDAEQWDEKNYEFDYIGASWLDGKVGNGGFSFRTKRLHDILAKDDFIEITSPEDNAICLLYRSYLEQKYGIKYATKEIADKFSFELNAPLQSTFGFHAFHHSPYKPVVVIKRDFAMGDVLMCEPVLHYFHQKGYNVVLDTQEPFYLLFQQHYFSIFSKNQIPSKMPVLEFDLNMAYEAKPKQNHLKSYYEMCGISDGKLRNPLLRFPSAIKAKLFKKYCILHIDERPEPYRNIYGVDWEEVVYLLNEKGYDVIQLGTNPHEKIKGAIEMNTLAEGMLMYVVGGADLFVGIDSGIAHMASGFQIPSIIFFGSVDPEIIYPDLTNKICINNHDKKICDKKYCWHDTIGTNGQPCYVNEKQPPCTQFTTQQAIDAINQITNG